MTTCYDPHLDACSGPSRRRLLRTAAIATGLGLVGGMMPIRNGRLALPATARAAATVDYLLLSCIDYRLPPLVASHMAARGLTGNYDQVVLAGASLGAWNDLFPAWSDTFFQNLGAAIALHDVNHVILLDHRDCGAYQVILGESLADDPDRELAVHSERLALLRDAINQVYPQLQVEMALMALDGTVTEIDVPKRTARIPTRRARMLRAKV